MTMVREILFTHDHGNNTLDFTSLAGFSGWNLGLSGKNEKISTVCVLFLLLQLWLDPGPWCLVARRGRERAPY